MTIGGTSEKNLGIKRGIKRVVCFLSLFAGISGFDLAAYWAGLRFDGHYFSEIDKYAADVFQKRFPEAIALGDVRRIEYGKLPKGDWIVAGGPPCQPFSNAGKKLHREDTRNLWPEAARVMAELRPAVCIFENVFESLEYVDGEILPQIEDIGYKTLPVCLSARAIGADHTRKRLWIVAYPDGLDGETWLGFFNAHENAVFNRCCQSRFSPKRWMDAVREAAGGNDGVSERVGIKCYGNAIVPQCAELFFMLPFFDRWRVPGGVNDVHP
jgi:DNA (cytosine-5)-methyltransferase 1